MARSRTFLRLLESPDNVIVTNSRTGEGEIIANAEDSDAIVFGFYKDTLYTSDEDFYREWQAEKPRNQQFAFPRHADLARAMAAKIRKIFDAEPDYGFGLQKPFRELLSPCGRIWLHKKIIAFWQPPTPAHVQEVCDRMGWDPNTQAMLQPTPTGDLMWAGEWAGEEMPELSDIDRKLLAMQHRSPEAKRALKALRGSGGFGSSALAAKAAAAGFDTPAAYNAARGFSEARVEPGESLWHLTQYSDFQLDPDHVPEQNYTSWAYFPEEPAIYLTHRPDGWFHLKQYYRPFIAEIGHDFTPDELEERRGCFGEEFRIPAQEFNRLKVLRTIPFRQWQQEVYKDMLEPEIPIGNREGEVIGDWVRRNFGDRVAEARKCMRSQTFRESIRSHTFLTLFEGSPEGRWDPAIRVKATGEVITGVAHYDAMQDWLVRERGIAYEDAYGVLESEWDRLWDQVESGFVLPDGRFLEREEADLEWKKNKGEYYEDPDKVMVPRFSGCSYVGHR